MVSSDLYREKFTAEEAERLVREYKKNGSQELRNQLVLHYSYIVKGIVSKMANTFYRYASAEEMLNQGVIAIIDSLEKFDPSRDVKFSTYAFTKVRGSIIDYVRKQDWLPRRVRQANIRISNIERDLTAKLGRTPTRSEMAKEAGMSLQEYDDCMVEMSGDNMTSFEALLAVPSQMHPSTSYGDEFDPQQNVDRQELKQALADAIDELNDQERTVLSLYYYENLTMREIGQTMGVSEQRIGQINRKLIKKLREKLTQYMGG